MGGEHLTQGSPSTVKRKGKKVLVEVAVPELSSGPFINQCHEYVMIQSFLSILVQTIFT